MFRVKNILILFAFIIFTTLISQPSHFFYENVYVGEVSDSNIFSPKNHRYIDELATNKLKSDAIDAVQDVYTEDNKTYETITTDFSTFIASVITAKEEISSMQDTLKKPEGSKPSVSFVEFRAEKIKSIKDPFAFSDNEIEKFVLLEKTELNKINEVLAKELKRIFDSRITEENLDTVKNQFKNNTNFYYFFSQEITNAVVDKVSVRIVPNFMLDKKETDNRKQTAADEVDDVYKVIKKGELIVRMGDVVTQEQYNKLVELGFIKSDFDYFEVFKQLPYFALIFGLFYLYCFHFYKHHFSSMRSYLFLLISLSVVIAVSGFVRDTFFGAIPLLTLLMIYMAFWGRKFVIFASIILGLLLSIGDFVFLSLSLIAGIALTLSFSQNGKRMNFILSGLAVGCALFFSDLIIYVSLEQTFDLKSHASYIVAAFTASVLTIGLIPVMENLLGLVTSVRLYELSDPNHPLLKRLLSEALGTYTHSLMVANLAEMAAEKVKANGLLLRVGAYFHDVGKLKNPEYFIENSTPETNPHKKLDPVTSAHIIREHPIDSVKMCREFKIPEPIIDLIISHHGDATLEHLYRPAKEKNPDVSIEEFKYQTPPPRTKEEGILLLADSTEAYSRVLRNEPKDVIEKKIREMIMKKVEHGILRECDLTFRDLEIIIQTFTTYLVNSNHERISYNNNK